MGTIDVAALRAQVQVPHDLLRVSDGATLYLRRWEPAGKPRVTVLLFHGITAYSEPYGPGLAEPLARAGVRVVGLDLRGHGLSDGRRGDYPGPARLEQDVAEAVDHVASGSGPVVALGHSLGSICAALAVQRAGAKLHGLVLLSVGRRIRPGVYARPTARQRLVALFAVSLLRGTPLLEYRRAGMAGLDDPLFDFRYSARFYRSVYGIPVRRLLAMLRSGVIDTPRLHFEPPLPLPVLVAVGDQDELFSVESTQELHDSIPAADRTLRVIPGGRHARATPGTVEALDGWLADRFGRPAPA